MYVFVCVAGDVGTGTRMKLVANMVMGAMLATLGEGLRLGHEAGLDPDTIAEVLLPAGGGGATRTQALPPLFFTLFHTSLPRKAREGFTQSRRVRFPDGLLVMLAINSKPGNGILASFFF